MAFRFHVTKVDGAFGDDKPATFFVEDGLLIVQEPGQAGIVITDMKPIYDTYEKGNATIEGVLAPGRFEPLHVLVFSSVAHVKAVFQITSSSRKGFRIDIHAKVLCLDDPAVDF